MPIWIYRIYSSSGNPNGVGISVIRNTPRDFKIASRFNLMEDRIAHPRVYPVLRDILGCIQFSVPCRCSIIGTLVAT